ncbi:hypothetical protein NUW58_g9119 [Xylaria curta]|uniref:Uncharacterized protein n=1 Tax=Xylaria curta TaxID=42375 RepID=A0ACC1N2Q6_9PEZI|nr:hypothetical protein NUW58_g9119 [Xylaria curta]
MPQTPATSFRSNEGEHQPKKLIPKSATHEIKNGQHPSLPSPRSPNRSCISNDDDDNEVPDRAYEEGVEEAYKVIYQSFCGLPLDEEEWLTFYLEG